MPDAPLPARLAPPRPSAPTGEAGVGSAAGRLGRRQKAAIIVRFLINEGADVPLADLPEDLQAQLTTQMGRMRYVDRATLADVVAEFAGALEAMGLTFPRGVAGALSALDGRISPQTAARLRKQAGVRQFGDPWEQVCAAEMEALLDILQREADEVAAVLLAKLDVARAADLLGRLPGETARRITYAVSQTEGITPEAVDRIGLALAAQLHDRPETAFQDSPVDRVGEILNYSAAATRDAVLTGLDETDEDFATLVRRAIFTFAHIPRRLSPEDVPKLLRAVEQPVLVRALAAAGQGAEGEAAEFLLNNLSRRMAESLREEVQELATLNARDGEAAMTEVVVAIRRLQVEGEITLRSPEVAEDGDHTGAG